MELTNHIILLGSAVVFVSVLASVVTARVGAPLLLVFLVMGMLFGEDGPGGITFDDIQLAHLLGNLALAVILFIAVTPLIVYNVVQLRKEQQIR